MKGIVQQPSSFDDTNSCSHHFALRWRFESSTSFVASFSLVRVRLKSFVHWNSIREPKNRSVRFPSRNLTPFISSKQHTSLSLISHLRHKLSCRRENSILSEEPSVSDQRNQDNPQAQVEIGPRRTNTFTSTSEKPFAFTHHGSRRRSHEQARWEKGQPRSQTENDQGGATKEIHGHCPKTSGQIERNPPSKQHGLLQLSATRTQRLRVSAAWRRKPSHLHARF